MRKKKKEKEKQNTWKTNECKHIAINIHEFLKLNGINTWLLHAETLADDEN